MEHLLLLSIVLLIIGLFFLVYRWPQGHSKTFSQHAAAQRLTIYYYAGLFVVILPLLTLFFYDYFIPKYQLSLLFSFAIFLAITTQLVAAIIPEIGGWRSRLHRLAAGWSAFGLFLAVADIMYELPLSLPLYIFGSVTLLVMLYCSALTLKSTLSRKLFEHRYFLWLQVMYYTLFFGMILLVTYVHS
jgi:hypothetical protein